MIHGEWHRRAGRWGEVNAHQREEPEEQ
jgi:hypothetical protein